MADMLQASCTCPDAWQGCGPNRPRCIQHGTTGWHKLFSSQTAADIEAQSIPDKGLYSFAPANLTLAQLRLMQPGDGFEMQSVDGCWFIGTVLDLDPAHGDDYVLLDIT